MMKRVEATSRFGWIMSLLSAAFVGGLFLDGWAHTHGRVDDTFFTPWHAVLYGGWGACLLMLVGTLLRNVARGRSWRAALPTGYGLSLAGALLWFVAGPTDLLWHSLFGFEAGVEALLSPAHLLLALGMGLVVTGPLRAALSRDEPAPVGWSGQLPMVLSVTSVLSVITFFMSLGHPLSNVPADATRFALVRAQATGWIDLLQSAGVQGMLAWMAVLMAAVFFLLGRRHAPTGSMTFMLTLNGAAMGLLYPRGAYPLAPVASLAVAGVVADVLRALLRPSADRPLAWRIFSFRAWAARCPRKRDCESGYELSRLLISMATKSAITSSLTIHELALIQSRTFARKTTARGG